MNKSSVDLLIINAKQVLTMNSDLADCDEADFEAVSIGVISNGAVAVNNGQIADVGTTSDLLGKFTPGEIIDAQGKIVTPGLIDPHTHLVFGGSRHLEFGMRMRGDTYHEILAAGGGIHSSVRSTRASSIDELVSSALPRLNALLGFGVTTAEVKSGYGLNVETEIKMLEAVKRLDNVGPLNLVPTFLGAHVVPAEFRENREEYVKMLVSELIPEVSKNNLAVACDVFLDEGAFSFDEAEEILSVAQEAGLRPKIHAGQFTDKGGPELVAQMKGLSADHLELVSDAGVAAMAGAGVVANLLPGAAFSLRDHFPDGRRLIDAGVKVAVATDDNPGTSRTENLPLMASMAVARMGLTCAEAWQAITVNAALALGLESEVGSLIKGNKADISIFSTVDFRQFLYHFGMNHTHAVIIDGKKVL